MYSYLKSGILGNNKMSFCCRYNHFWTKKSPRLTNIAEVRNHELTVISYIYISHWILLAI